MKCMNVIQVCAMTIGLGLCGGALLAQAKSTTTTAGTKVGAINMRVAIVNTAEGKQAAAQLETEFMARRKELEDLSKKISDIQQRLATGEKTLSDEEKERLTLQGQRLSRQMERRQNEFQEDLNNAQSDVIARISRKLVEVVGKYAPSNGYSTVLDNSSQSTPVMYASADITQEIVRLYDETYPVKSASGAADGKPASKAVAKPSER